MTEPLPVLISVSEVARRLSCPRQEVYTLIREGQIIAHRLGARVYRVSEADLNAFIGRDRLTNIPSHPREPSKTARLKRNRQPETEVVKNAALLCLPVPAELDPDRPKSVAPPIPSADTLTIAFLMDAWLEDARGRVRPKTYLSYEQMTRLHIVPILGRWRVDELDIRTVERFFQFKYQSGLSARSVQYLRALLRQAYNEAIRWGWLSRNVSALARGPKAERPRVEVIPPEEARRLLDSFARHRYGPVFVTALGLGLRLGEVLGLRWGDVQFSDPRQEGILGQLTVRVQLQRIGGECELVSPKSRTSIRALSLPSFVEDALRLRHSQQREERAAAAGRWNNPWNLVFTNRAGEPLDESRVRQRFREHLTASGFSRMRLHDLRHLCASLLLSQGTNPRVLMEILGHSQISLTLDTYAHVMPSAHPDAARAMEKALRRQ